MTDYDEYRDFIHKLSLQIKKHEGSVKNKAGRHVVYDDADGRPASGANGVLTIGYGRNLQANGISEGEAMYLFHNDVQAAEYDAKTILGNTYNMLSYPRKATVLGMLFNLGAKRFTGFKNMIASLHSAVLTGDYDKVAYHMEDSKWYTQVGHRAEELKLQMMTGGWQ